MIKSDMEDSVYRLKDGSILVESIVSDKGLTDLAEKAYDAVNNTGHHMVAKWEVRGNKETTVESMVMDITNEYGPSFTIHVMETSDKKVLEPWFTVYPENKEELKNDLKGLVDEVKKGFHKQYGIEGFEHEDEIEKIRKILPHGSGINGDWKISVKKDVVVCKNEYDRMNEVGMYDGVFPFSVRYTKDDAKVKFHSLTSKEYRIANGEDLKGYLEDMLCPLQKEVSKICNLEKMNKIVVSQNNLTEKTRKR